MKVKIRHFLSSKDVRVLKKSLEEDASLKTLASKLGDKNIQVEYIKLEGGYELYKIGGEVLLAVVNGKFIPSLKALILGLVDLPKIVVDMGAVPYISRGADLMAPGVVEVDENIFPNELVVIVDENHRKPIAVGQALFSSEEIREIKKGKVAVNLHFVGDKLWEILKKL